MSGDRIMNPLSQKTGIETRYPINDIAVYTLFGPINLRIIRAIVYAPPDFSRKIPSISPETIIIPIFPIVPPNPVSIDSIIFPAGIPEKSPKRKHAASKARNGCSLNLVVEMTIKTMQMKRRIKISIISF